MKKNLLKIMPIMTLLAMGGVLASCNNNGGNNSTEKEIALGSSVLGNWKYRTSEGKTRTKNNEEIEVYVDAETKFHFTITKYYEDFAPSVFTYEGQITGIQNGVGSCAPVFTNAYLSHGAVKEDATTAAKAQFTAYRATLPDMYEGDNQFKITFHRLASDTYNNGYITVDNTEMDLAMGVFDAVDNASSTKSIRKATDKEIALGSSVLGNWGFKTSDGKEVRDDHVGIKVYVDAETKFHFTITKYYEDFAPSVFTYEGQITGIQNGVGSCAPVFTNAYLSHGAVKEDATTAVKAQFTAYRATLPDMYEGDNQFKITFHRLTSDVFANGYITVDNAEMDLGMGTFGAVDK